MGKRQRLAVLRLTVNQFPSGKHWRFNSSLPHALLNIVYVTRLTSFGVMNDVFLVMEALST